MSGLHRGEVEKEELMEAYWSAVCVYFAIIAYTAVGIRLMSHWDDDVPTPIWIWAWPLVLVVILGAWVSGAERTPVKKFKRWDSTFNKRFRDYF